MPARLISVINMKGGVGKSTTTCSLAETLALHQRRRVLVIDLDPQTNASIMLAGPEKWNAMRENERTLDFYFESYMAQQRPKPFKQLIEHKVTDLKGKPDVSLCASAPEFRIVERDLIENFVKKGYHIDAIQKWICERFANGLKTVINDFDYILIDCPPGISLFAEAALIAADAILVPTIPDYVSRLGLITFRKRALRLINERRGGPSQLYVVATKYDESFSLHRSEAALLKDNLGEAMFDVRIHQHVDIAKAAEWAEPVRTFDQKYGAMAPIVAKLGEEFVSKVDLAPAL
ncbi:chromosome (plasmid) partitioning protein ParA [alpha proteobacterium U9-1i]|nr:chromosome (plasmid) partitioning protein ParA [alpha proteobacterium U9-1i]